MTSRNAYGAYVFPQAGPFEDLVALAKRLEAVGYDSLWVADETPMAYPEVIEYEAFSVLSALARETSRIRLGTLVTPPVLRHPLMTAMAVTSVDHASNGRVTLGMGVGGVPADLEGVGRGGISNAELVNHLDEQLDTIDRLLRGETVTRTEGFYPTTNAVVQRPVQQPRPPILVAAHGPKSLRVAARRADVWNSMGGQPIAGDSVTRDEAVAIVRRHVELLEEACAEVGRDPGTIRRSAFAWRAGVWASRESLVDWLGRFRELGFSEFIFALPDDAAKVEVLEGHIADERAASIG